jgi:hypothetical protein
VQAFTRIHPHDGEAYFWRFPILVRGVVLGFAVHAG